MRIKVFGPLGYCKAELDERGWMTVPEGTTYGEAINLIGIPKPFAKAFIMRLNMEDLPYDTVLNDGDVISCFSLMSGG